MPSLDETTSVFQLFSDATRIRLAALLAEEELSVAELTTVTELAQSRVSTHLARLRDAGLLRDRRAGSSTFYRLTEADSRAPPWRAWELARTTVDDALIAGDRARVVEVLAARGGAGWPDSVAGRMERHYSPGRTWEALTRALVGLAVLGDVLDIGTGDGTVPELLAPAARRVVGLERSEKLVAAAADRLARFENAAIVLGDMHALPFEDATFDRALMLHVLQYTVDGPAALAEARRVLRPGGRLIVTTLAMHDREDVTSGYGHAHRGYEPRQLRDILHRLDLRVRSCEVTSRERRSPHFRVITAIADVPDAAPRMLA